MSSRIDRYRPEGLIGSAGVVDTFRVRLHDTDTPAVLKVLFSERVEPTAGRQIAERFLSAGRNAFSRQVAGSARILEVSDHPETAFIAVEFVPGFDLSELVSRAGVGGIQPALAGLLCAEVADILVRSHEKEPPLFHLGLCPGNVRVTAEGEVVVLDFGLAAALRTMQGCRQEKWDFAAPELAGIDAATMPADAARGADAYSLGLLLCHLLGAHPGKTTLPGAPAISRGISSTMRALTAAEPRRRPDLLREVVEPLAGGLATADERHVRLSAYLEALQPRLGQPARVAQPFVEQKAKSEAMIAPVAAVPIRRSAAFGPRRDPGIRGRVARGVVLGGALFAFPFLVWRFSECGGRSGPAPAHDTNEIPAAKETSKATAQVNVETQTMANDGGLAAGLPVASEHGLPGGQGYLPDPDQPTPSRQPNHLFLDTQPSQADVWVDGVLRGKAPVDLELGPGGHRVVVVKSGYLMLRAVYDTTKGEYTRRELQPVGPPRLGNAFIDVKCATANRYPVLIDDEETGRLCPASRLPVVSGKHTVGIFVPGRKEQVAVEVNVPAGVAPTAVNLRE